MLSIFLSYIFSLLFFLYSSYRNVIFLTQEYVVNHDNEFSIALLSHKTCRGLMRASFNNTMLCCSQLSRNCQVPGAACQKLDVLNNGALCHMTGNASKVIAEQCGQRNAKIGGSRNNDRHFCEETAAGQPIPRCVLRCTVTAYFSSVHKRNCVLYPIISAVSIDVFSNSDVRFPLPFHSRLIVLPCEQAFSRLNG